MITTKNKLMDYKIIIRYVLLFILYFIMQYKFINDVWFGTDELDIFAGGMAIKKGYLLYGDFISQHMPFSYIISAIFYWVGADTISLQRVAFYILYSIMWIIIVIKYNKVVNPTALILYPIIFTVVIPTYDMGTTVLSEHLAGIGFVILLLEFYRFYEENTISIKDSIMISVAIMFTFGTIFVAAFGVFVVFIGVFLREVQNNNKSFMPFIRGLIKKYWLLVFVCVIPWILLCIYLALNGVFETFVFSAYTINRTIYPNYLGGYGGSILQSIFGCADFFFQFIKSIFTIENYGYNFFVHILFLVLLISFVVKNYEKDKKILWVTIIIFLFQIAPRGMFNFHGTQWVEVSALLVSIGLIQFYNSLKSMSPHKEMLSRIVFISVFVIIISGYASDLSSIFTKTIEIEQCELSQMVEKITDKDEAIWDVTLGNNYICLEADRASILNVGGVPWIWDGFGVDVLNRFGKEPLRVALFNAENICWDYEISSYAPELIDYVNDNYIQYNDTILYIRKDYYAEACSLIEK